MKTKVIITLIALMSTQAFSADLRDASFKASSKVSNFTLDKGKSSINETLKVADITAEKMKGLLSKNLASTANVSKTLGKAIVDVSEFSKPVFKITGEGLAIVFKASGEAADQTLDASKKLVLLLDPASKVTGNALEYIFEKLLDGSEVSSKVSTKILDPLSEGTTQASDVSTKLLKIIAKALEPLSKETEISSDVTKKILVVIAEALEKPLDATSDAIAKISKILLKATENGSESVGKLITKGSETGTKVTDKVIGRKNAIAGLELTGKGISLTSKGIGSIFYLITKGVTGITEIFEMNKEEIQKAVERNDQETLAGLKEYIRAEINSSIDNGDVINQLLTDEDLDAYIELRLEAMNS